MNFVRKCVLAVVVIAAVFNIGADANNRKSGMKRYALIVGSNNGGDSRTILKYARDDAKAFMNVLVNLGGVTKASALLVEEPGAGELLDQFHKLRNRVVKDKKRYKRVELIFYYSGHSDEQNILLGNQRLSYKKLRDEVNSIDADVKIAILDSCASGAFTRLKGGKKRAAFLFDGVNDMKGYAFMSSSSSNEASQESDRLKGSFFTHNLVAGLRGAADSTSDGRITLNEAYRYAFDQTLKQTAKTLSGPQHPNYNIQMSGTGGVVMTDLRRSSARLILERRLGGNIFINDARGNLVAEVHKPVGKELWIGLEEGRYRIINIMKGKTFETFVELKEKKSFNLYANLFRVVDTEHTVARGETKPEKADFKYYKNVSFKLALLDTPNKERKTVYRFSLFLLSSYTDMLDGVTLGAGVSFVKERMVGAQVSGIGNAVNEDAKYFQAAGIFNTVTGNTTGYQTAGVFNYVGKTLNGFQSAGFFNFSRGLTGLQIAGGFNYAGKDSSGMQIAGGANIGEYVDGLQLAGGVNWSQSVDGVQLGTVNIVRKQMRGLQLGVVNIAAKSKGLQLGVVNVARKMEGFAFGLANFMGNGETSLNLWVDETGFFNAAIRHGNKKFYNLYIVGYNSSFSRSAVGWGYGIILHNSRRVSLSCDIIGKAVYRSSKLFSKDSALLASMRFVGELKLNKTLSLFGGVSYNYYHDFSDWLSAPPKPFHKKAFSWSTFNNIHWPGVFGGIKLRLF